VIYVFSIQKGQKKAGERKYINQLSVAPLKFASELKHLWEEYEE
jgi:hypothetical protein